MFTKFLIRPNIFVNTNETKKIGVEEKISIKKKIILIISYFLVCDLAQWSSYGWKQSSKMFC